MRLTLRARILAAFLVALVAFVGALGYGIAQVRGIGDELARVQDRWLPLSREVTALRLRYPELNLDELEKQPSRTRHARAEIFVVRVRVLARDLATVQRQASAWNATEPATNDRMRRVVDVLGKMTDSTHEIGDLLKAHVSALDGGDPKKIAETRGDFVSSERDLLGPLEIVTEIVDEGLRADAASAESKARSSLWALAALTAVVTAFGLASTALVWRALAPIGDLIASVKQVSAGDFTRRVQVAGDGEISVLAGEFNQMAESLNSRDERLRRLSAYNENVLESVRVGILVADADGRITGMNRAAEEIWGVSKSELVGRPASELGVAKPFLDRIEQVRAGGPAVRIGKTPLPNGRTVEVSAVPFLEDGKASGVVVVAEDVSERVRVEEQLVRSEKLAAIGRMSSQITHEVRNPLNSLSLNVEMLQEELGNADGESKALLKAIASEIERLTEVTEGYLSFARLPKPHLEKSPINAVVDGLVKFTREEAAKSGVQLSVDLATSVPEVMADENQLRQALLNVVRNALDAMNGNGKKGKGGKLKVSTSAHDGYVEVTLADDGPGITPKDLARIFDPFYSTKADGTGLGLPLTQQIIEEHGGTIACASSPGQGTTFTIRLPAA